MIYTMLGNYDQAKAGKPEGYFAERHCFIDYRGDLIIHPESYWGFGIKVITQSHSIEGGWFHPVAENRHVWVDDQAWICSFAILYNCHIQHHAIVSIGAVVKNLVVPPYHIASGNPARLTQFWDGKKWQKLPIMEIEHELKMGE